MRIKKGDQVKVLSGKDRGKTGPVLWTDPANSRLAVEGLNLFKKRVRPKSQGQKGETVLLPRPMHSSKVQLICQSCKRPTRVGYGLGSGAKSRHCKRCGAVT